MSGRQNLGRWGEDLAAEYLQAKGYAVAACNLRNSYGEIDLLAQQGEMLAFVEVRTRSFRQFGYPKKRWTRQPRVHHRRRRRLFTATS